MTIPSPGRAPLVRSSDERMLAGVCGGLAAHLGLTVLSVRIAMLVFALLGGAGGLFYLWLWVTVPLEGESQGIVPLRYALTKPAPGQADHRRTATSKTATASGTATVTNRASAHQTFAPQTTVPETPAPRTTARQTTLSRASVVEPLAPGEGEPDGEGFDPSAVDPSAADQQGDATRRMRWPVAELLLGACLLLVGVLLVLQRLGVELQLTVILPGLAVLVGVGLTWWQIADRDRPDRNQMPRVLGALALVAVGVLMFFVTSAAPSVWTVIAAALAVLAGVALAIAPWLLRLNRELIAERAGREREAERSEIAAHLHDSVLQTLALIQQRSEPGSEVARIARGQERELRDWLFHAGDGGPQAPRESLAAELRAHAVELEHLHAVQFETVNVGGDAIAPEAIVAAAKEAMLNAARHAGGTVTVFAEVSVDRVAIDVTDRGPGLDLDALPDGRMGVRESILGRMSRAGGSAKFVRGPGGTGTSVRLEMPRLEIPRTPAGVSTPDAGGNT
ncbi:MAG: ATP-binding protein [Leucobacter sp.]